VIIEGETAWRTVNLQGCQRPRSPTGEGSRSESLPQISTGAVRFLDAKMDYVHQMA